MVKVTMSQMQIILATRTEDRIEEVTEQADRIPEVTNRTVTSAATTETKEPSLAEKIKKLKLQVTQLSKQLRQRERFHKADLVINKKFRKIATHAIS